MENTDWQSFEQKLRQYISKRVPADTVDDIVGDVVLRLVTHEAEFQAADNPIAWMYRVTTHIISDYYRSRGKEEAALKEYEIDDSEPSTEASAAIELTQCILPFINNLASPYKEALLMTEIDGLKQKEGAKKLGLSISGMKSRVQRGRVQLREEILRCCEVNLNQKGHLIGYDPKQSCC